jgi:hypothetical protein
MNYLMSYLLIGQNKSAKLTENGNVNSFAPLLASLLGGVAMVQVVLQGDREGEREEGGERERKRERGRGRGRESERERE